MASALKVGILTFHKCINNGSYWQARCLVEHLRSRGHAIIGAQGRLVDEDTDEGRFAALPDTPVRPSVDRRITELRGRQDCAVARSFADAVAAHGAGAKLPAMPLLAAADSIRVTGKQVATVQVAQSAPRRFAVRIADRVRPGGHVYPQDLRRFWRALTDPRIRRAAKPAGHFDERTDARFCSACRRSSMA